MLEQYLFIGLLIGGLFGLILTFTRRHKKSFAFELLVSFALIVGGTFGPTLFNFPPTPYVLFPALSFDDVDAIPALSPGALAPGAGSSPSLASSKGSIKVSDSGSGAPVAGAKVTAIDIVTAVSVTEETNLVGVVSIPLLISKLTRKIEATGGTPGTVSGENRELTIVASVPSGSSETKVSVDGTGSQASDVVDVHVDILPPLSESFLGGSRVESISGVSQGVSSEVLIPIVPAGMFSPRALEGQAFAKKIAFERTVYGAELVVNGEERRVSTVRLVMRYTGDEQIGFLEVRENLDELKERVRQRMRERGINQREIELVVESIEVIGVEPKPVELRQGQVISWLFAGVKPGDEVEVSYTVNTAIDENVVKKIAAPVATSVSDQPLKVVVKSEFSSFSTTTVLGLFLASIIVVAIAVFFVRRN